MRKEASATIYDVAKAANVSAATVSRYINGRGVVSELSGRRIAQAMSALSFCPNRMAQALKTSRTNMIMMVVPDIGNSYYSKMYELVQSMAAEHSLATMLYDTTGSVENELTALDLAQKHWCDGLYIMSLYRSDLTRKRIASLRIPYFHNTLDRLSSGRGEAAFEYGTYNTTRHLIACGHRHIVYVGGSPDTYVNLERRNGFMKAMEEAGLPSDPFEWFEMDFTMEAGYKAGRCLSAMSPRPTAVCAANDQLAFGIMVALSECGLRVPEDISITGMDDVEYSRLLNPPLTTVRKDLSLWTRAAMAYLLGRMAGRSENLEQSVPAAEVIIRGSTRRIG